MRYEVDSGQVAQASAKVGGSVNVIHSEVGAMMRHLTELQGCWRGSAASQFSGVMSQWQATQRQVERALTSIQSQLSLASRTYADAEAHAARLFSTR
ncbi:MAG: WXG100 family type VII secretion target [Cellulomonadaceae bacterium]|jgi:WXG100 family type VII secretion target|nr:WXG100 family type VII secretion target [Cellulomonadaceae bacterium]